MVAVAVVVGLRVTVTPLGLAQAWAFTRGRNDDGGGEDGGGGRRGGGGKNDVMWQRLNHGCPIW
jgi:hypothetical protein